MSQEQTRRSHLEGTINKIDKLDLAKRHHRCYCNKCRRFVSWNKVEFTYSDSPEGWIREEWCKLCKTQITKTLLT